MLPNPSKNWPPQHKK